MSLYEMYLSVLYAVTMYCTYEIGTQLQCFRGLPEQVGLFHGRLDMSE